MPEIRVDPLSGRRAIVAGERANRPGSSWSVRPPEPIDRDGDPFAEGNEDRTPPELYALRADGGAADGPGWSVRVVPNLYPALCADAAAPDRDAVPDLFTATSASGAHEVIVNGPQPVSCLLDLGSEQVARAVEVWRERMRAHEDAACRHLIVNERLEAGASLAHSHAQLYALGFVPEAIARERERFGAHAVRMNGQNLLSDLLAEEVRRRERVIAIDDEAVLLAPYASALPYQMMLVPRQARARFEDAGPSGAALLYDGLGRLARLFGASPPLNIWVRTAPRGAEHYCWRIEIAPRLTHLAGLELGAGVPLNVVAPERAAAELRDA